MRPTGFLLIAFVALLLTNCAPGTIVKLSDTHKIAFLDSLAAANAIVDDDKEGYFDRVTLIDMSVQLKKKINANASRDFVLEEYRNFLRQDVAGFSSQERRMIKSALKRAFANCQKLSPQVFPKDLELIKTRGKHYGPGTYYTRENRIIIPADALATKGKKKGEVASSLYKVLLHEIFHVYSRYHEKPRRQLYSLIGFKNIYSVPLQMDEALKQRILLNPDGLDLNQVIELKRDSNSISTVPLIISSELEFQDSKPAFFNYLKFDLYQVMRKGNGLQVISNEDGTSTLRLNELPDFFQKIKDNTSYIIHPDEIMADNFMFLILSLEDPKSLERFSPQGRKLIEDIRAILSESKNP